MGHLRDVFTFHSIPDLSIYLSIYLSINPLFLPLFFLLLNRSPPFRFSFFFFFRLFFFLLSFPFLSSPLLPFPFHATEKVVALFRHAIKLGVQWVVKTDDDVSVLAPDLLKLLQRDMESRQGGGSDSIPLYASTTVLRQAGPIRTPTNNQWALTYSQWPFHDFPPIPGDEGSYVLSTNWLSCALSTSVPPIPFEEVMTSVMAAGTKIL